MECGGNNCYEKYSRTMCKRHEGLMRVNCGSENMLTHETANRARSYMSERAKTDQFQTKLTRNIRGNLTKLYINILNNDCGQCVNPRVIRQL